MVSDSTGAHVGTKPPGRHVFLVARFLVIPLAVLLFAQWPLREWVQAYSRQANDMAQALFAVYVATAISAATVANVHLAATMSTDAPGRRRVLARAVLLFVCVVPWALFMLWAAVPHVWSSLALLERFPDTLTPGFFVIKLALGLLLLLVVLDGISAMRGVLRRGA